MKKGLILTALSVLFIFTSCSTSDKPITVSKNSTTASTTQDKKTEEQKESTTAKKEEATITKKPNEVIIGISQDFDFLDPHKAVATGTQEVMFNIFTGLVNTTPDGKIIPEVSEKYEISEDLKKYTFTIKNNVIFHNGAKATSKDVSYSYNRLLGKTEDQTEPLSSELVKIIESIETPDDKTVVFNLVNPDASFLSKCLYAIIPENTGSSQNETPIGAGPFKFVSYTPGLGIKMAKNEKFYIENQPILDKIEFKIFADANAGQLAMENGEINIMNVRSNNIKTTSDKFTLISAPQNMVQLLALNQNFEPFKDIKVRQALNYAINKTEIIDALSPGSKQIDTNFSPVMDFYYNKDVLNFYPHDVSKAKELLKESGHENLTFVVKIPSEYQFHIDTGTIIQQQLAAVGVTMNIETIEWNSWLSEVYADEKYEATIIGLTGKIDPAPIVGRFTQDYAKNFINYSNDEYDSIIKKASLTANEAERATLYKEAQMKLTVDAASIYIMDPANNIAIDNGLEGYNNYPIGYIDMKTVYYK